MPNAKDTFKNKIKMLTICLLVDSIYIIPIINHYL